MNNLPNKNIKEPIGPIETEEGLIRIYNNEGYRIVEIAYNPSYVEGLARSIATVIIEARDIGYKQCQKDFRDLLDI